MKNNRRDEEISIELKNGEPFIWTENTKCELDVFLDFALNGVGLNYGYDHLIYGFKEGVEEPYHVATCRGKKYALECVVMFNNVGLTCVVIPKTDNEDSII